MSEDNNIYARWLNKELTEEEKSQLKNSGDLDVLEKIVSETDSWTLPEMKEDSYQRLKEKVHSKQNKRSEDAKVIPINRNNLWIYSLAASVLIAVLSVYFIFFVDNTVKYQSQAGQQLKVTLPDQTVVILNGQSSIAFDEKQFSESRNVALEGEGYFEVTKKGDFKVKFAHGEVKVLGTKFNILSGKNIASIKCFEGKVMVSDNNKKDQILTAGKGVRLIDGISTLFEFTSENPDWLKGESIFKETPLIEVINALSIQYNVEFEFNKIDTKRNYAGKFVHNDLKTALNMVFTPMGITYSIEESEGKVSKVILQ